MLLMHLHRARVNIIIFVGGGWATFSACLHQPYQRLCNLALRRNTAEIDIAKNAPLLAVA